MILNRSTMKKKITRPADLLIRQSIKDTQYNMYVVRTDAAFLDGFQIVPNTNIFGIHKGDQKFLNFKRIYHKLENRLFFQFYLFAIISFQISSSERGYCAETTARNVVDMDSLHYLPSGDDQNMLAHMRQYKILAHVVLIFMEGFHDLPGKCMLPGNDWGSSTS